MRLALYLDERGWRSDDEGNDIDDDDLAAFRAPVAEFASAALDKRLKKVTKLARDIDHLEVADRHELRKRLKKLRYTLSFFTALFPRADTKAYLHRLTQLQDVFGALNDLEMAHAVVRDLDRAQPRLAAPGARLLGFHERRARKEWQSALKMWRNFRDQSAFWR